MRIHIVITVRGKNAVPTVPTQNARSIYVEKISIFFLCVEDVLCTQKKYRKIFLSYMNYIFVGTVGTTYINTPFYYFLPA